MNFTTLNKTHCIVLEKNRAPFIFDKRKDGNDTDDHATGDEDDDDKAGVHIDDAHLKTFAQL